MKLSQTPRYVKILVVMNVLLMVTVIGLVVYGSQRPRANNNAFGLLMGSAKKTDQPSLTGAAEPVPAKEVSIAIGDKGFVDKGFQIFGQDKVIVHIANNGTSPHSFVIDKLNINSGDIPAGQTRDVLVNPLANESAMYDYYSLSGNDSKNVFAGVMMVVKK